MTTLKLILIVLPSIEILVFILILIFKDRKQKKEVPHEDVPARYEEFEEAFYNP
jgi:hypothetical protein